MLDLDALYESNFDWSMNSFSLVTESPTKRFRKNYYQEGEVYSGIFPYDTIHAAQIDRHSEFGGFTSWRLGIVLRIPNGKLMMFPTTTSNNAITNEIGMKLTDPLSHGFTKDPVYVGLTFAIGLFRCNKLKYTGFSIDSKDLEKCKKNLEKLYNDPLIDPVTVLNLIKTNVVGETTHPDGNNNLNQVQSIQDVLISKRINCVDTANVIHLACKKVNAKHGIVTIKLKISDDNQIGHVVCLYHSGKGWNVVRVQPKNGICKGEAWCYEGVHDLYKAAKLEANEFMNSFGNTLPYGAKVEYEVYPDSKLHIWDSSVDSGATQKELLEKLHNSTHYKPSRIRTKPTII